MIDECINPFEPEFNLCTSSHRLTQHPVVSIIWGKPPDRTVWSLRHSADKTPRGIGPCGQPVGASTALLRLPVEEAFLEACHPSPCRWGYSSRITWESSEEQLAPHFVSYDPRSTYGITAAVRVKLMARRHFYLHLDVMQTTTNTGRLAVCVVVANELRDAPTTTFRLKDKDS